MIAFSDPLLDGQLQRAIGHTTYGGADLGECLAAAAQIRPRDRASWRSAWMALAERTHAAAEASERGGHRVSAHRAFLRASNYYRTAYLFELEPPVSPALLDAFRLHRAAFARAAALAPHPLEPIEIPCGETSLAGYFCRGGEGRRPIVVAVGGYDSTAEECYFWNAAAANQRGYHAIVFDGPGQGRELFERGATFAPDWTAPLRAAIDAAVARPDVDPAGVVVIGESFGGYLVPRGAAGDRRIAACVLDPPQLGLFRAVLARLPLPRALAAELPHGPRWLVAALRALLGRRARHLTGGWALRRGMLTHGVASPWEYVVDTARYEQAEIVPDIRCPTAVCAAENDELAAFARPFYDALTCTKTYLPFSSREGAGEHCEAGARALYHERVFDWLDATLRLG